MEVQEFFELISSVSLKAVFRIAQASHRTSTNLGYLKRVHSTKVSIPAFLSSSPKGKIIVEEQDP